MYIIYEKDNLARTIFEIVFKNTGSAYAKDGVAYFLAHTLSTRGTEDKKEKFYSELDERAINLNVTTNKEFTTISMSFLNEKSSYAVKKLIELLQNPNFTQDAFEKTKNEILSKKENLKNNNDY
ncbi:MAG: insulinase family protein, partial [Epsilonproteobacteria bacterium]|nr:insulinase family protein [Campylobacterota bacterium]